MDGDLKSLRPRRETSFTPEFQGPKCVGNDCATGILLRTQN